ncbi:MAG TPA: DNA-directed RNA polymerase subunit beta', partial [Chloroflexota bacterium]
RMGHIELASPVSHIWFVKGSPSRIGLLLDITPRVLEQVLYFAKYIVTSVDRDAQAQLLQREEEQKEARLQSLERGVEDRRRELQETLEARKGALEEERAAREQEAEERYAHARAAAEAAAQELDQRLADLVGKAAPETMIFAPTGEVVVREDEAVRDEHRDRVRELLREHLETMAIERDRAVQAARDRAAAEAEILDRQLAEELDRLNAKLAQDKAHVEAEFEARKQKIQDIQPLQTLTETEYRERQELCGRCFKAGMGAEAIRELLRNINLDELAMQLRDETRSSSGQRRKKATKRLRIVEAFRKSGNKPEWMILTILPVLPPDLRPMVQLDGGRFATSDLNDLYRRVINRNNRLKRLVELGAPEIIVRNEKRMLQEAVDSLIDNGRRGRAVSGSSNHKLKSLSDMLKGKQGRFRQNLLGKRVDYSGRSVIVVGPTLKLNQCGLPKRMALELFKPFVMRKLVERGHAHNIKSAKRIVERVRPEVWDVLEEVIQDHLVLLNRAPTLHRLGIQAFEPVLIEGSAIQIHPLVCAAFNADFDGDQMAVHVPLSAMAKREAREFMLSTNNLLLPSNGEPVTAPTLDIVLGCYSLTMMRPGQKGEGKVFASFGDAQLAYDLGIVHYQAPIKVRVSPPGDEAGPTFLETTVGRIVFNETINRVLREAGVEELPFNNDMMDKGSLKKLVADLIRRYGNQVTAKVLDALKELGFRYATVSGLTIAISDIRIPEQKEAILAEADAEVARIEREYRRGLITDEERYNEIIEVWTRAKDRLTEAVRETMDPYGSLFMMAQSGAKGNIQQIAQMAGMRGLMADPSGRIIELPIRSSFRGGLSVLEYFLSTHGARKGLADTAIRTADSGYLTRRLVDVAQSVIVFDEDCGTDAGIWIRDLLDPDRRQIRLDQMVGRVLASAVVHPQTGEVLVERNEAIDEAKRDLIAASGVGEVHLRSPMTCESRYGICRMCYGWQLAARDLVRLGEAVGIIAAQSIGEPGTQLTMRTFHTGGVAGVDITSGLPRVEELFEARVPKGKAVLAEIDGVVEIPERVEGELRTIRVVAHEVYRDEYEVPQGYELQVTPDQWVEVGQELARSETGEPVKARMAGRVEVQDGRVVLVAEEHEEREYQVPLAARILVGNGQPVAAGAQLTEGHKDPADILRIQGREAVQRYLVDEVQEVYRSQGVHINDKHIEIIVRQMLRRLRVDTPGDTDLLPGELVDRFEYEEKNRQVLAEGGEPATAQPVLLGVTKASLNTDSFLAAASFQETTKVLTEAAIVGKVDRLMGLKENVIIGKLIPAGTGYEARLQARRERLAAQEALRLLQGEPIAAEEGLEEGEEEALTPGEVIAVDEEIDEEVS